MRFVFGICSLALREIFSSALEKISWKNEKKKNKNEHQEREYNSTLKEEQLH